MSKSTAIVLFVSAMAVGVPYVLHLFSKARRGYRGLR